MTLRVAKHYYKVFSEMTEDVQLLSLQNINVWERGNDMLEVENKYLAPANKLVLILPEYNGSIPGIFKLMMDNSNNKKCWWHKKAMLVGLADGRAGNARGLDHVTNMLHYLKVNVYYNKIPLSRINDEIDNEGNLLKPMTDKVIREQVAGFIQY